MKLNKDTREKLALIGCALAGFGMAYYWMYRYDKAVTESCLWSLKAIEHMEDQRKTIEALTKGSGI